MKLRNKKTGEIGEPRIAYQEIYIDTENHMTYWYKTLYGVFEEFEYLHFRIAETTESINEHKKRIIKLKQQKKKLRKELLENQQLLWRCGGEE